MAGIVFSDSFSGAKPATETRVINRRQGDVPFSTQGRVIIARSFHCSWAAVLVALDGDVRPAVACSQLLVSSSAGAASQRPGCRAVVLAKGRFFVPLGGYFSAAAGLVLRGGRV